jgi:uncharacterized protein YbjT (DUF2867 family)
VTAASDEQVPHMVFSSVASADQHTGVPHFESKAILETDLVASGLPYTITAPTRAAVSRSPRATTRRMGRSQRSRGHWASTLQVFPHLGQGRPPCGG